MHLHKIEINNFLSIGRGEVEFDNKGLTLIEGVNEDSPTSDSNGAGKSSLFEAIYWLFYGKTKRGYTGNDVVNTKVGKDCSIVGWFDDYKVVRARKHESLGHGLHLYHRKGDEWEEITKGTIKETQALLVEIVGMSELTFSKVAQFGQGDVKDFAVLTDRELKAVFEEALGLTFFREYFDAVKEVRIGFEQNVERLRGELRTLEGQRDNAESRLDFVKKAARDAEEQYKVQVARYDEEIEAAEKQLASLRQEKCMSPEEFESKRAAFDDKRKEVEELRGLRSELEAKFRQTQSEMVRAQTQAETILAEIQSLVDQENSIDSQVGEPCKTCGRTITEAEIGDTLLNLKSEIAQKTGEADGAETAADALGGDLGQLDQLRKQLDSEIEAKEGDLKGLYSLEAVYENGQRIRREVDGVVGRIEALKEAKLKLTPATYSGDLEQCRQSIKEAQDGIVKLLEDIDEVSLTLADIKELEDIFGNSGLKSYALDNVTPELNKLIHRYISKMDDIAIEVSTLKRLKNGDLREKFEIKVSNSHGAPNFKGQSGGEKQKVNVAIALGFNALCRAVTDKSLNFIFLDEVFESLDKGSSEPVADLCMEFAKEIPNVFLITHREGLAELIPNTLKVRKRGGAATFGAQIEKS